MEKWKINVFDDNLGIKEWAKNIPTVLEVQQCMKEESCDGAVSESFRIFRSLLQRSIVESLIISDDCDDTEISELTGVSTETLLMYRELFFRVDYAFSSKIDAIDYIETNIDILKDEKDSSDLNLFLLKRWSLSLGKEFVVWKFRLLPIQYSADRLYSVVMKEAFFYHKEKSMGNTEIPLVEYLRSTSILLSSVKASTSMVGATDVDAGLEILEQLDIMVAENDAPAITLKEMDKDAFINNATNQETT